MDPDPRNALGDSWKDVLMKKNTELKQAQKRVKDHTYFDMYKATSGNYYFRRQINGKTIECSLKTPVRSRAIIRREALLREHLADVRPPMKKVVRASDSVGFVYVLRDSATNRLKIGTSKHPSSRIAHLQRMCSNELELVHLLPGGRELETEMHRALVDSRLHGEWFEADENVLNYLKRKTTI